MDTPEHQLRRLLVGPSPGERPGGMGIMDVEVVCAAGEAEAVLAAARAGLAAQLRGEVFDEDLDVDADWGLWSLTRDGPGLRLQLVVFGFPVSGFSGLRRFLVRCGAVRVEQRAR